jgi:hypothetical protein
MPIEYSGAYLQKYFGEHYGRINPARIYVNDTGRVDFDFGKDRLFVEGITSYAGLVSWYLGYKVGRSWISNELAKPAADQHQLAVWRTAIGGYLELHKKEAEPPGYIGADICYRFLGYHLALIAEHATLSRKLVERLKISDSFQAARFEIRVAAAMITAGFELEYRGEKGPGKHPEFIATDLSTGQQFAVEAKTKRRDGVLGFINSKDDQQSLAVGVRRLLRDAVEKDTELPLIAFVDVNLPDLLPEPGSQIAIDLAIAWETLDKSKWAANGFPCIGGFFCNDAAAYFPTDEIDITKKHGWAYGFVFENRHGFDATSVLERIKVGFATAARIPDLNWKVS